MTPCLRDTGTSQVYGQSLNKDANMHDRTAPRVITAFAPSPGVPARGGHP